MLFHRRKFCKFADSIRGYECREPRVQEEDEQPQSHDAGLALKIVCTTNLLVEVGMVGVLHHL